MKKSKPPSKGSDFVMLIVFSPVSFPAVRVARAPMTWPTRPGAETSGELKKARPTWVMLGVLVVDSS